jgi:hypothetical protein
MRTLGGAFGAQIAATFLADNLGAGHLPTNHGYTLAFALCTLALVAAVVAGLAIPGRGSHVPVSARTVAEPA